MAISGDMRGRSRRRVYLLAGAIVLLAAGCRNRAMPGGDGGDGGPGDLGGMGGGGGDLADAGTDFAGADLLGSPDDLQPAPDLMPRSDLGGWIDPAWNDPTGTRNLTNEGTTDWAHWGLTIDVDHRAGHAPLINAVTVGTTNINRYTDNHVIFDWSDGTPTSNVTGTATGIFVGGAGNGFELTVPAEPTAHTLRIYLSSFGEDFSIEAHVSDSSAYDYTDTVVNNITGTGLYRMYTFTYKAQSPGQTMTVKWIGLVEHFGGANVTLQAATLQ